MYLIQEIEIKIMSFGKGSFSIWTYWEEEKL